MRSYFSPGKLNIFFIRHPAIGFRGNVRRAGRQVHSFNFRCDRGGGGIDMVVAIQTRFSSVLSRVATFSVSLRRGWREPSE